MKLNLGIAKPGLFIATLLGAGDLSLSTTPLQAAERQTVRGHVPAAVTRVQPTGRLAASLHLDLAIGLPLRNQAALAGFLQQLYDPASPNYRRYLTPEQFAARFGPTEHDYQAVVKFVEAKGLRVADRHPNRLLLDVNGSVAGIEKALHVALRVYQHPTENRTFYAPDAEPSLDLAIPVLHISGLDNYSRPRPRLQANPLTGAQNTAPKAGSGPSGTYRGNDFRAAYVPDSALTGSGQVVGLVQFDGYTASDITYYEQQAGLPNVPLQNVLLDGFSGNPTGFGGEVEVSLDIEMAISMAPGLSKVIVYMAGPYGNWHDMLNRIATDNLAKQISCSWYIPHGGPDPVADQIWQQMAAQGQSFLNASGDYDAYTGPIDFPGDSPYITQVGGTTLSTTGPGGVWLSEKVWNWGNGIGSGAGISTTYSIPAWQTNCITPANQGSNTKRNTPDVALTADNVYVRANGQNYNVGGTSCAAPLWAGFMALVNQRAVGAGKPTLGFVNPAIYALGTGPGYAPAFHDITTGNNESPSSPARFSAVPGYDLCTGWGTPGGSRLITALATPDPLLIVPGTGFAAIGVAGGPFNLTSQNFSLTNTGTGSLSWTLVNTSLWLTAAPSGGALTSGGPAATVTVSLNFAASNLVVGLYTGTLWFTNLSEGFGQSLPLASLAILDPPVITNQPPDQAVLQGASAAFTVGVSGSAPISFQWLFNGTNLVDGGRISGSASSGLTLNNVAPADVGPYSVIVSNPVGMATSLVAHLTITPSAPVIITQPADQAVFLGRNALFSVGVAGSPPFAFQWSFNGTNIGEATTASLSLTNVQFAQAGNYAVVVTNILGSTSSSNAMLTVNPPPPCLAPPPGLVSWWRGEGNALDSADSNDGTLAGTTTYGPGEVGQGFVPHANGDGVRVGPAANLQLQTFSIEAWLKRASTNLVSPILGQDAAVFCYGSGGYGFGLNSAGQPFLTQVDSSSVAATPAVTDTNFHHVAVTRTGSTVTFYVDGVAYPAPAYGNTFAFTTAAAIGARGDNLGNAFLGTVDEVSVYNRALSDAEIQSIYAAGSQGKCALTNPPAILSQPTDQVATMGGTAFFSVGAAGAPPLSYQWNFNGTNLSGATGSSLTLTNVQFSQAGNYAVLVSNAFGSVLSSNAALTVNAVPPTVLSQPVSQTVLAGTNVIFSITASGTPPLSYQWLFNSSALAGQTNALLSLTNVQTTNTGDYSVLVTNLGGPAFSSNALLTVLTPRSSCVPTPSGLVSWWRGEGNALDQAGANNGTLSGNTSFDAGMVGLAFVFDGSGDGVTVGNPASLQLQNFTIEAWIKRASTTLVSAIPGQDGLVFGYGAGGYGFGLNSSGQPDLSQIDSSSVLPSAAIAITDTNFHHVAVTRTGPTVTFYVDGVAYPAPAYGNVFAFTANAAIGARGDNLGNSFLGRVDEPSVYNRALSVGEVQSIYVAGTFGKCAPPVPPFIISQPSDQTVGLGGSATFSVTAGGTLPLSYQWSFNGSALTNATNASLTLTGVTTSQAGPYVVVVTNLYGSAPSSNANLSVNSTPCATVPSGLVSWWRGEGNALDQAGTNNGTPAGNTSFDAGMVGLAFIFDGSGDGVTVGNPASLQLQNFTIEAWIKRASTTLVSAIPGQDGLVFGYGAGGYGFGLNSSGQPDLSQIDSSSVLPITAVAITDTSFHHVAVTRTGSTVTFYVDGVAYPAPAYGNVFAFTANAAIGARGDNLGNSFLGRVDEPSVYNRALSAGEVQSIYVAGTFGKCAPPVPPLIISQPSDQTVGLGGNATFSVIAGGTLPLSYQWRFNGSTLTNATNASLSLTGVTTNQAGGYTVLVTNLYGSVLSSNANLTVNPAPCAPIPMGLVSWWRGEGNALDEIGTNNGTLAGNATFGAGEVGQAFIFDGSGDGVQVGNPTSLQLQDFTIEAWIRRASPTLVSSSPGQDGLAFGYGGGGYGFGLNSSGQPVLSQIGVSSELPTSAIAVTDTNFHHVAVTRTGSTVAFYVDGVAYPAPAYGNTFIFTSTAAIGARGDNLGNSFLGKVDEMSICNRALSTSEIQAIYSAGGIGKCDTFPPVITSQSSSQTAVPGSTVNFSVSARGTAPLSYQWYFNSFPLPNSTNATLTLTGVSANQTGIYVVLVTNLYGQAISSNMNLFVNASSCATIPMGLVSWWRGEGNGLDSAGANNGTLAGNTTFGTSEVGQGFVFDGTGDGVQVGNPANLQLQNFTIEGWIKRASVSLVSGTAGNDAVFFSYGAGGYGFGLNSSGHPLLSRITANSTTPTATVTDTNFHHLAVTKSGTAVIFYIDGAAYPVAAYTSTFTFTTVAAVGARGDNLGNSFLGTVDELSIYNRSLSAAEIQSIYNAGTGGKCINHPPIASNMAAATKQNLPMSIPVEKFLLLSSDPDGDPLVLSSVSATSTNGGPVSVGGGAVSYTPVANYIGADRFTYSVNDGRGGTGSAFVIIQVASAGQISGNMFPPVAIPGGYSVTFAGVPSLTYTLQRATNVSGPWLTLGPVTVGPGGIASYADTSAPPVSAYYRSVYP